MRWRKRWRMGPGRSWRWGRRWRREGWRRGSHRGVTENQKYSVWFFLISSLLNSLISSLLFFSVPRCLRGEWACGTVPVGAATLAGLVDLYRLILFNVPREKSY